MRLCLAFMVQNEREFIALHLPVWIQSAVIDGVVALDGGSHDGSASEVEWLCQGKVPCTIGGRQFAWNFSEQANALIKLAQDLGYTALLRLDPDELVFPAGIATIKQELEESSALWLPRVNFEGDRLHWRPVDYPDYQLRAFRLDQGYRYVNAVHELLADSNLRAVEGLCTSVALFHYEAIRPNTPERWLKHNQYARLAQGLPPLDALPDGFVMPNGFLRKPCEPFDSEQPLNPLTIGIHAPFEGVNT